MTFELIVKAGAPSKDEKLFTLAIEVHASDGTLLKEGVASPRDPLTVTLPKQPRVHLLTRLPGGEQLQRSVDIPERASTVIVDMLSTVGSPHEWLKWASSLRDLGHLMPEGAPGSASSPDVDARDVRTTIGGVWALLWEFRGNEWIPSKLKPASTNKDRGMRQIEFMLPKRAHLLQVGGESVSWRLVSLPSGGAARVAFTDSQPGVEDTVQITIGRQTPGEEVVMSYLTRGALPEAMQLEALWQPAEKLLRKKDADAIGAAAGAYVMLRIGRLEERNEWAQRLVDVATWMSDGPIIAAAVALRLDPPDRALARRRVSQALHRGLPVFGMGLELLVETMTRLHRGKEEERGFRDAFLAMQGYLQARASRHAYLSFFGETPTRPSSSQLRGKAGSPVAYVGEKKSESSVGDLESRHATVKVGSTKVTLTVPKSLTLSKARRGADKFTVLKAKAADPIGMAENAIDYAIGLPLPQSEAGSRRGPSGLVASSGPSVPSQVNENATAAPVRVSSNANSLAVSARQWRASLTLPIFEDQE